MPDLFVDTAGWGHLVDSTQKYHPLAQLYIVVRDKKDAS